MATMYRSKSGQETRGEGLLYDKIKAHLPDDYLVWHNQIPPSTGREIDFVVLHYVYGLWVVEVKDWAIDQLVEVDTDQVKLKKGGLLGLGRTSTERHPLRQARENMIGLKEAFQKHTILRNETGPNQGKLLVPLNHIAVLVNITREELEGKGITNLFPEGRVWSKDFVTDPYASDADWEKLLLNSREYKFTCHLDDHQINAVKRDIGVAVVLTPTTKTSEAVVEEKERLPYGTLDSHQSNLVHMKIEQQSVIEGPAGSGKSIVLLKRALYIHEQYPHWKIGVFCFNALMANCLRTYLALEDNAEKFSGSVDIYDVYDWVFHIENLRIDITESYDKGLQLALEAVDYKVAHGYDAILVDEGQDATETLIRLYKSMLLDPDGSFTFFFDRRQTLYVGSVADQLRKFGFDIDTEKNLVRQQRSALVLLALAYYENTGDPSLAVDQALEASKRMFDWSLKGMVQGSIRLIKNFGKIVRDIFKREDQSDAADSMPNSINLNDEFDSMLAIIHCDDGAQMIVKIADDIQRSVANDNTKYGQIAVLIPDRYFGPRMEGKKVFEEIRTEFFTRKIPYFVIDKDNPSIYAGEAKAIPLRDNRRTADLSDNKVKIMTIHASKGFDSDVVYVAGFDGTNKMDRSKELGYVALTRAKTKIVICCCEQNESVTSLVQVLDVLRKRAIRIQ